MERFIVKKMLEWKDNPYRKPLIIRGARQVGKSYIVREFGEKHVGGAFHCINFEKNPEFSSIFEKNLDAVRILNELEIVTNSRITVETDLLFFDEIQDCPKAIASLRYFHEQVPRLMIIAAGSLLEFSLRDVSFPVGRVQLMNMHPMCFREFLLARGKSMAVEYLDRDIATTPDAIHQLLRDELRNYFFVGGMPQCVKVFVETGKIRDVAEIQSDLLGTFRQDFSKYAAHSDKRCLNAVLHSVCQGIGSQTKYARLADGFSNPTVKKAVELLETARLIRKVHSTSPAGIPLESNVSEKVFKLVFLDIGLFSKLSAIPISQEFGYDNLLHIFRGAMAEQFVAQELLAAGFDNVYYWSREAKSSNAEVDYLVQSQDGEIMPIEVKSCAAGSLKSMHLLLQTFPNVPRGLVLADTNYSELAEHKLLFLPLYHAYSLFLVRY